MNTKTETKVKVQSSQVEDEVESVGRALRPPEMADSVVRVTFDHHEVREGESRTAQIRF